MAIELFNLVKEKMGVTVHLRIEKHGDENVNAYDVKLAGDFSNSVLLKLHPELRDTFYVADRQGDVEGFKKALRFAFIDSAIKWAQEVPRTKLTLHDIHDDAGTLVLQDGHTDKFEFTMLEGGTVKLSCRVKLSEPTEDQITKLLRANGQTFPVSLECAPLEDKPDNFEQVEQLSLAGTDGPSEARQAAEAMFSAPPDMSIANGTDGMTVIERPGGDPDDDVVDASFTPPDGPDFREVAAPDGDAAAVADALDDGGKVAPIKGKRGSKKAAVVIE